MGKLNVRCHRFVMILFRLHYGCLQTVTSQRGSTSVPPRNDL